MMMATPSAASTADDWAFIDPSFITLRGLVHVADPDRHDTPGAVLMGRDPETDWWLDIDWSSYLVFKSQAAIEAPLKRIREALLLTSVLASVNNKLWLKKLRELSRFVPAPFMDLTAHTLRPNYQFRIQRRHTLIMVDWEKTTKFLCGCKDWSKEFLFHVSRATELSDGKEIVPPRLQLHVFVPTRHLTVQEARRPMAVKDHDIKFLVHLETMIQQLQTASRLPVENSQFALESLHLDMRALYEHAETIKVLERIVLLGVHIDTIFIPLVPPADDDRLTPEWRENWISFVTSLGNHREDSFTQPRVSIHRLWVGRLEVVTPEFTALCSAMLRADNVKMLQIGDEEDQLDVEGTEFFPPGVWELIAATFLSHNSRQTLESLSVVRVSLSDEDTDGIFNTMAVSNPLQCYFQDWVAPPGPARSHSALVGIRLPRGTAVTSQFGFEDSADYTVTTHADVDAILLSMNGDKANVFIDGRGFCSVPQGSVPTKRTRLSLNDSLPDSDTAQLQTFQLTCAPGDTTTRNHLHEIFGFAFGLPLQALRLEVPGIDEETIQSVLRHCPNLQHLTVSDATLNSLAVFETAIVADGPLQSLELGTTNVRSTAIEVFLDKCRSMDGNAPEFKKLERLRFRHRLEKSALDALSHVAWDRCSSLRYLHYYVANPDQSTYQEIAQATNGMPVSEVREQFPASSRWAFLQALHRLEQRIPGMVLTDYMKEMICLLAATPNTRTVICGDFQPQASGNRPYRQ